MESLEQGMGLVSSTRLLLRHHVVSSHWSLPEVADTCPILASLLQAAVIMFMPSRHDQVRHVLTMCDMLYATAWCHGCSHCICRME